MPGGGGGPLTVSDGERRLQSGLITLQHGLEGGLVEPGQGLGGGGGGADGQTDLAVSLHPAVAGVPPHVAPVWKVNVATRGKVTVVTVVRSPPLDHRPWTSQSHPAIQPAQGYLHIGIF